MSTNFFKEYSCDRALRGATGTSLLDIGPLAMVNHLSRRQGTDARPPQKNLPDIDLRKQWIVFSEKAFPP